MSSKNSLYPTIFFILFLTIATPLLSKEATQSATSLSLIRNKKDTHTPLQINSPSVYGVRPNHPILFKIAAIGNRPLFYHIKNLPASLTLDNETGIIKGMLNEIGTYNMKIRVEHTPCNCVGSKSFIEKDFTIICGEEICLTAPMGFNSWYCFSESVSQEKILNVAHAIKESGLIDYGYSYINIDDCWQGQRGGEFNGLQANSRFPNIKSMVDTIHEMGLKVGIYSTPWISTYAGFRGSSCDSKDGFDSPNAIAQNKRLQIDQIYGRYPSLHRLKLDRVGSYTFYANDILQWAQWGFDFLKLDWHPNDLETTKTFYTLLRKSGRDIVLSLSNTTPFDKIDKLSQYANLWRTTKDIQDNWHSISSITKAHHKWQPFQKAGHFNDPDMLQLGNFGETNSFVVSSRSTSLNKAQQISQFSYWSLFSAPLLLSCDIKEMDKFTFSIITNTGLIRVNQDSLSKQGKLIYSKNGVEIIQKELDDGSVVIGFFNKSPIKKNINFPLKKYIPFFAKAYQNLWHDVIDEELIANLELQTTFADATPSLSIKGKLAPFQCEILQFYK